MHIGLTSAPLSRHRYVCGVGGVGGGGGYDSYGGRDCGGRSHGDDGKDGGETDGQGISVSCKFSAVGYEIAADLMAWSLATVYRNSFADVNEGHVK
jgi:hypothetical protein